MSSPYDQARHANYPRATCTICFRPMRYANPQICDSCYAEMSKAGQLRQEKENPCPTTSKQ